MSHQIPPPPRDLTPEEERDRLVYALHEGAAALRGRCLNGGAGAYRVNGRWANMLEKEAKRLGGDAE